MTTETEGMMVSKATQLFGNIAIFFLVGVLAACGQELTPDQHLEKARAFLQEKKVFEGIIELKNALQKEANLPEARWLLGEAYLKLGNGSLASREFNSARSLGFSHDDMEDNQLRALNQQGKFQEVLTRTDGTTAQSDSAALQVIRGDAFMGVRKREDARAAYERALEMDPDAGGAWAGLARLALSTRDLGQSESHVARGLEADPDNEDLWVLRGMLALVQNQAGKAEEYFSRADEIAPYNRMAKVGVIRSRYALQKFDEARQPLKILESRYGNSPTVKYLRAYLEYQDGNVEAAESLLLDALNVNSSHPESLLLLSNILYQDGKLEQVIDYMERFTSQFPGHLPAVKLLAVAYLGQKEVDKTIELIQQALKTNTADDQLYSILGTAYIRSGNMEKATEYLERAAEINPNAANIRAQLALSHLAAGSTDLAVSALEDAVQLDPKLYSADIMLILTHIRSEEYDKAIQAAENLHKKEPDNPLPLNLLGTAHAGKLEFAKARGYFKQAIEKNSDYSPAKFNLANLDIEEGNLESAEQRFKDILKSDNKSAKAYVGLAKIENKRENEEKMLGYLRQARDADERSIEARVLLARYYKNSGRNREMLEVINEAAKLAPNFTEIIFMAAQAQRLNGEYDNARKNIQLLTGEFPDSTEILMEQALLQMDLREFEAAEATIKKILDLKPDHERALLAQVNIYLRTDRPEEARKALRVYADAYPDSPDLDISRGDIALYEKDYTTALEHYRNAQADKDTSFVVFRIVNTYLAMNDTENARTVLEKWVKEHPDNKQVKLVLASRYHQENDVERAIELYEEVVRDDATNMIALNNLAWLYLDIDARKALQLAERAFQLAPEQAEVMDTFGWILVQQGSQLERGVSLIQSALDKKPDVASIRYHYAYALARSGNRVRAMEEVKRVIRENPTFPELNDARALLNQLQN